MLWYFSIENLESIGNYVNNDDKNKSGWKPGGGGEKGIVVCDCQAWKSQIFTHLEPRMPLTTKL